MRTIRKNNLLFFLLTLFQFALFSQTSNQEYPNIIINSKSESVVSVSNKGNAYLEIPPWVTPGGWRSYYFSTHYTQKFSTPGSLANDSLTNMDLSESFVPTIVSSPLIWWHSYRPPTSNTDLQFRRNYQGIFSAHAYNNPNKGDIIIAYSHGENKNEIEEGIQYQNTILPSCILDQMNPTTYNGYYNGTYHDSWESYFGFVNMQWIENSQETQWGQHYFWEEGPIVWPSNGYITDENKKASFGLRHPSSILNRSDNYFYIYFLDTRASGVLSEEGRYSGIKLVRVKAENAVFPTAYEIYYEGNWYPSLPAGYSKDKMMDYLKIKGPKSSVVVGGPNTIRFTVAKMMDDNYYLGVEECLDPITNQPFTNLRLSKDLINWSAPKAILSKASSWINFKYNYPIFLDSTGWTNTEIGKDNFFILGTKSGETDKIYRMKLSIRLSTQSVLSFETTQKNPAYEEESCKYLEMKDEDVYFSKEDNYLYITLPVNSCQLKKEVIVYDIMGKLIKFEIFDAKSNAFKIDVSEIRTFGVYLLVLQTEDKIQVKKFIVN